MRLSLALLLCLGLFLQGAMQNLHAEAWLVLPLVNKTGKKNLDWVGEAAAEALSAGLAGKGQMVIDRPSRQEAEIRLALRPNVEWTLASALKLAELLDTSHVVLGTAELDPSGVAPGSMGMLRLKTRVVGVHEYREQGQSEVAGPLEDLGRLSTKLAWLTLRSAGLPDLQTEDLYLEASQKVKITAIENYVRGLLVREGDTKQKFFEQALKIEPRYGAPAFELGKLLMEKEAYGLAASHFERVQKQDPNYWQAHFQLGLARFEMGEYRAAASAFEIVAKEIPLSEVNNNLGISQFRGGMPDAIEHLRRALEGDSRDPNYHFNLGLLLMGRGLWSQAADEFRATLDRDKDDVDATKLLGRCLRPPETPTPGLVAELRPMARPKFEFNEFAYRQLKSLLVKPGR